MDEINLEELNDTVDSDDSEEITLTAAEVIEIVEEAWINEKFAPEILPHKEEIIDCLQTQLSCMEKNLESLRNSDFQKAIHQLEVDRLKYIVTSYLRTRLEKIEKYVFFILKQENQRIEKNERCYLSSNELEFAKEYKKSELELFLLQQSRLNLFVLGIEEHFEQSLSFWPGLIPDDWKNDPVVPNKYSFVFLKSKADVEGIAIDEEEGDVVDLKTDSQMIVSYNSVSELVKTGKVKLI